MRVPDEAGEGKAEIKVSFAALTAFKVAATTGVLVIRKPPAPEAATPEPARDAPQADEPPAPKPAEQPHGEPPAK